MPGPVSVRGAVVKTLVVTDIVDSTELLALLGDERGAAIFEQTDRLARDLLVEFRGREIDRSDGFLLLFDRPIDATRYALAYHNALASLASRHGIALAARAGIHLGEVYVRENPAEDVARGAKAVEVDGLAKATAARVAALATAKQTLLTQAAFHLVRRAAVGTSLVDAPLEWLAHGPHLFKGTDEPVEVFEVGIVGFAPLAPPCDTEKARRVQAKAQAAGPNAIKTNPPDLSASAPVSSSSSRAVRPALKSGAKRRILTIAPVVLLAAALGVAAVWRVRHPATSPAAPRRVLVLVGHFANRTGEAVFDETLQDLVSTAIEQSRVISVYPTSRVREALARMERPATTTIDEDIGREIVQREGLRAFVSGSISRLGSSYALIVRATGPGGASLASEQRTVPEAGKVPAELDVIVQRIRTGLGESLGSVQATSAPLAQVTSVSLDAVRYLTLGRQRLDASDAVDAAAWFQKAVALDPSFAMAYEYLGVAYQNIDRFGQAEQAMSTAAKFANRVTETERLRILGDYHVLIGDFEAGCNDFSALAQLQPDDPAGFHGLGLCHARLMQFDQALEWTRRAQALLPKAFPARHNIARIYLNQGELVRAKNAAEAILSDAPNHFLARRILGRVAEVSGQTGEARRAFETMIQAGGAGAIAGRMALADLLVAIGRPRDAQPYLQTAIVEATTRGDQLAADKASIALADLYVETGAASEGLQILSRLAQAPADPLLILKMGRTYAHGKRLADANRMLTLMHRVVAEKPNAHVRSLGAQLESEIAFAEAKPAAVASAEMADRLEHSTVALDQLARAYDQAGRTADAIKSYEGVLARAAERADTDDDPAFARVVDIYYRLGVLLQDEQRMPEARVRLDTALKFWSNADPTLAKVKDASERRRRLG